MSFVPIVASVLAALVLVQARNIGRLWEHHQGAHSFNVGIAVAYVFVDLFPHIAYWQQELMRSPERYHTLLAHSIFVIALAGFVINLGLVLSQDTPREASGKKQLIGLADNSLLTLAILAVYCFMVGYMMTLPKMTKPLALSLFTLAMCIHLNGLASLLRHQSIAFWDSTARYVLGAAVVVGCIVGVATDITLTYRALLYAFVSGAVVVIATAYELPKIQTRNEFPLFTAGAVCFAVIVIIIENQ